MTEEPKSADSRGNPLGIPSAVFIEDVDSYMKKDDNQENAELVLRRLDEQHSKYKFMEVNLIRRQKTLERQMPEIKTALDILKLLKDKYKKQQTMDSHFLLSDQLFAKAIIPPTGKICLWLGANVMLEYNLDDATTMLSTNITTAEDKLKQLEEHLDFLKDQTTTTEVNMARVFNWDVKRRQSEKESSTSS